MDQETSKYADAKRVIEHMAMVKLHMNSHKGNIEDMQEGEIIDLLRAEAQELEDAAQLIHVIEEAADVYNFLLALVHKKVTEYRERK